MGTSIKKTGILLADGGGVGENLCRVTYTEENPLVWTSPRQDGVYWIPNSYFEVKPSTTYMYSVCCDGTLKYSHGTTNEPEKRYYTVWLYICNDGTTKNWQAGQYDTPVNFNSTNYGHVQIGNRHIWTYTTTATQRYMSVRVNNYSDGETNLTLKYWDIKIEEASAASPFTFSTDSTIYTGTHAFFEGYNPASIGDGYASANEFYEI